MIAKKPKRDGDGRGTRNRFTPAPCRWCGAEIGPNRYYLSRLSFAQRWLDDSTATSTDLLIFEAYPWHSTAVTAPMRPPPDVVDAFVWQPIADLPTREVFAFGRPWDNLVSGLGLPTRPAVLPEG